MDISSSVSNEDKKKWFERFLRFGLISKGIVYCLLGLIAVMAAVGLGSEKASKTETLDMIYGQPFGRVILVALFIGIMGYVTLRSFQCFRDSDQKGDDMKGLITRTGYGFSALLYLGLGIYVLKMLLNGSGGNGDSRQLLVTKVLELPWGQWMVGITALIVIGSGINQMYKGFSKKFLKKIKLVRTNLEKVFTNAGVIGYISRGLVLAIIGYLLLHAAITSNPEEAKGSEEAFDFIENRFGTFLMGVVAFGLVAYGMFMFVKARYQRLNIHFD